MSISGWIVMILSVGGVTLFFGFTLFLVFKHESRKKQLHSTLEETPDVKDKN
ncbi:MAG: hypothetical protein OEV78_11105 [Spirochaetia bacterium]|nr:hypothetical protein [Spirochaetia bacterium]